MSFAARDIFRYLARLAPRGSVVAAYPVAGSSVDLAVGEGRATVGVVCGVHPDGPDAHIERHLALRRAGWRILDTFESRWLARPDAAVETIVQTVLAGG